MGRYSNYHPTPATRDYMTKIPGFMDQVGTDIDELAEGKADANHSHGAGGEVVSIGAADARPAVTDGFIHSEPGASADETALVVLNADGTERARAIMSKGAQTLTGSLSLPTPTAPEHAATKSYVDERIVKGFITGLYPAYRDGTSIDVAPGVATIGGQIYELPSAVTLTPTLTASSWHYIYISATPAAQTLTDSDFIISTTAPSRSSDGWYDASGNRCIGFFYAQSTPAIARFAIGGEWMSFVRTHFMVVNTATPPTTPTAVTCPVPVTPCSVNLSIYAHEANSADVMVMIFPGNADTSFTGGGLFRLQVGTPYAGLHTVAGFCVTTTEESGNIYYMAQDYSGGAIDALYIYMVGVQIPDGMGRP